MQYWVVLPTAASHAVFHGASLLMYAASAARASRHEPQSWLSVQLASALSTIASVMRRLVAGLPEGSPAMCTVSWRLCRCSMYRDVAPSARASATADWA